jgi:hypothetical protein
MICDPVIVPADPRPLEVWFVEGQLDELRLHVIERLDALRSRLICLQQKGGGDREKGQPGKDSRDCPICFSDTAK